MKDMFANVPNYDHVIYRKEFRSLLLTAQADVSNENGQSGHIFYFTPHIVCRPVALYINHDAAHHVIIRDIECSNMVLLAGPGDLPGELFCEKRRTKLVQPQLDWQSIVPGGKAVVRLTPKRKESTVYQVMPFMLVHAMT